MISTDGVFGKKTDNGDVRLDHSGHYNIHKPDNVAVTMVRLSRLSILAE